MDGRLENVRAVFSLLHLIVLEMGSRVQNLHVLKVVSTPSMYELTVHPPILSISGYLKSRLKELCNQQVYFVV